jgi:hypothetical protein
MSKKLTAAAVIALKDAICSIYWYKRDLRQFLQQCLANPTVLATLNWENYKRQIVSDLVDYLCRNPDKHIGDLTTLCYEVCNISSFSHLAQLEGGDQKVRAAKEAISHLQQLVKPHQEAERELEDIEKRQRQNADKLRSNQALREKLVVIKGRYMAFVTSTNVQGRGFELEKLMYDLFDLFDLDPKASFRNNGEQIDGAFSLDGTEYLFEAKWQKKLMAAAELDSFAAKVNRKLENTLGVFLSINGFSTSGIAAHSAGRVSIILMDGADLMAVFEERIDFTSLLLRKKRHASQTGSIYLTVADILR